MFDAKVFEFVCHIFNIRAPCFSGSGTKLYYEWSNFKGRFFISCGLI